MLRSPWFRSCFALAVFAGATSCSDLLDPADAVPPAVTFDSEVDGELSAGEAVYQVMGVKGRKARVVLLPTGEAELDAEVTVEGPRTAIRLGSIAPTAGAGGRASEWFVFPASVPYHVRIRAGADAPGGRFRFLVQTAQREVEVGDTIEGEILLRSGSRDADEYTVRAPAGGQVAIELEVMGDDSWVVVRMSSGETALGLLTNIASSGPAPRFLRFTVPPGGEFRVGVNGELFGRGDDGRGRYRLVLRGVDVAPEQVPPRVEWGEVVGIERIAPAGDIDEFVVRGDGREAHLLLRVGNADAPLGSGSGLPGSSRGGPSLQLVDPSGTPLFSGVRSSPRFRTTPGQEYRIRVHDPDPSASGTWDYALHLDRVDPGVEGPDSILQSGVWTRGALETVGDIDSFVFAAAPGTEYVAFARFAEPLVAELLGAGDSALVPFRPFGPACRARFSCRSEPRTTPSSGINRLSVRGIIAEHWSPAAPGEYEVLVNAIDRRPEAVDAAITLPATIAGESYFPAGDVDEFDLQVARDALLTIAFDAPPSLTLHVRRLLDERGVGTVPGGTTRSNVYLAVPGAYRITVSSSAIHAGSLSPPVAIPDRAVPYTISVQCQAPLGNPDCSTGAPP